MRRPAPEIPEWLAAMLPAGVERYRIDVGGVDMAVMEVGEGRPVLMVHGNPTWGFLYRKVIEHLAGEPLRLIAPDLIGLGLSDKPRDPEVHQLSQHGRWLGALIDALDLSDVMLVGQDWGGPIGLLPFAERKQRLGGLVILNTVAGPPRPNFKPTLFHRFAMAPVISDLAFKWAGLPQGALWLAQGDRRSLRGGDVARAYRWPLRNRADRVAPLALARMVPDSFEHPSIPALVECQTVIEQFDGPAAIVWGDRDPVLGRVKNHMARLLPQAEVTSTHAGHFLQEQVPAEIAEAIRSIAGLNSRLDRRCV